MDNYSVYNSLLRVLRKRDFDSIEMEDRLENEGYKVVYFIDATDLTRYCFPFGVIEKSIHKPVDNRNSQNIHEIACEQTTYFELFKNIKYPFFIFDHYGDELDALKTTVRVTKELGLELIESLKVLLEGYESSSSNSSKNFIATSSFKHLEYMHLDKSRFSLLLSILLGAISNGIERLNNLESDQRILYEEDYFENLSNYDKELSEDLESLIQDTKPSSLTIELFNSFYSGYTNKASKYADCEAIDRVIQLNKKCIEQNRKYLFILVCTSELVIHDRRGHYGVKPIYEHPLLRASLPIFNGITFSPLRSVNQLMARSICTDPETGKLDLQSLNELRRIHQSESKIKQEKGKSNDRLPLFSKMDNKISQILVEFENIALIDKYDALFSEELGKAEDSSVLVTNPLVAKAIAELKEFAEQKNEIEKLKQTVFKNLRFQNDLYQIITLGIEQIKSGGEFEINKGDEHVAGLYNILPIVFRDCGSDFIHLFNGIAEFYLTSKASSQGTEELVNIIIKSITSIIDKKKYSLDEELFLCLTLIILPKTEFSSKISADQIALKHIESKLKTMNEDEKLVNEYRYVAAWLARRTKDYSKAKFISQDALAKNSSDPRFYHSLALIAYNLFLDSHDEKFINEAIENCQLAVYHYNNIFDDNKLVNKAIISLYNTICYCYCLLFELNGDQLSLAKAAENFEMLIRKEKNYRQFPEFLHTGASLNKNQFLQHKDVKYIEAANKMIDQAITLVSKEIYQKLKMELSMLA